jgi:2-methylisocitrate lyase-like PEP mutase family enzyme
VEHEGMMTLFNFIHIARDTRLAKARGTVVAIMRGAAYATLSAREDSPMKMLAYLLAIICIAAAAMYYTLPAGQLPAFIPGHLDGSDHIHRLHAYAAAGAAVVLFVLGWFFGRSQKMA